MTRICITGGPKTGKTTLAQYLADQAGNPTSITVAHTDDLIPLGWSEASQAAALWMDVQGPWIIEGVAVSRMLRKWRDQHPGARPPVDRVIFLTAEHEPLTQGQKTMTKGVHTVHAEIDPWLFEHGIRTEYMAAGELRCQFPGQNGIARLG